MRNAIRTSAMREPLQAVKRDLPQQDGSSLINLLTIFEQIRGRNQQSKNAKISEEFEKSAQKIRDQFLKGFESRYMLARDTVASISAAISFDEEEDISDEAKFIKKLVLQVWDIPPRTHCLLVGTHHKTLDSN